MSHVRFAYTDSSGTTLAAGSTAWNMTSVTGGTSGAIGSGNGVTGMAWLVVATGTPTVTAADNGSPAGTYVVGDTLITGGNLFFTFSGVNITGSPTTLTFTYTGGTVGTTFVEVMLDEFSTELGTGKALDKHALTAVTVSSNTANATVSSSVTPASNGEVVWGGAITSTSNATLAAGTSPAYTAGAVDTSTHAYTEYLTQTTAAPIQATWTATGSDSLIFAIGVMTFGSSTVQHTQNLTLTSGSFQSVTRTVG